MHLDKNSSNPLYNQLMLIIKKQIDDGEYNPGDKIPTEPEISKLYDISRITVRKTIQELCELGILVKKQGKGTFVKENKIHRKIEQQSNRSFSDTCKEAGTTPMSKLISHEVIDVEEWHTKFLKTKSNKIIKIMRLLLSDGIPVIFEEAYFPYERFLNFPKEKVENGSLFDILKKSYNIEISSNCRSTIEAINIDKELSVILKISPGDAVINMINYNEDSKGVPVYISKEYIVGSRYLISI